MGTPGKGHGSWLQIGNQSAWGTPVAATGFRFPIRRFSPKKGDTLFPDESLWGQPFIRTIFEGGKFFEWELEMDANYLGFLKFWNLIHGTDSSPATPTVTGPDGNGLYTHVFKQGKAGVAFATLEVLEGGVAGVTTALQVEGAVATKLALTGKAGTSAESLLRITLSGIARNMTDLVSPAALSLVSQKPIYFHHAATITDGSADSAADVVLREWALEIAREIVPNRFAFGTSQFLLAPVLGAPPETVMTFTKEWQTKSFRTRQWAGTTAAVLMKLEEPALTGAAGHRSWQFSFPTAQMVEPHQADVDRFDILEETAKWRALYDGTSSDITTTIMVDSATIAAG